MRNVVKKDEILAYNYATNYFEGIQHFQCTWRFAKILYEYWITSLLFVKDTL